MGCFMQKLMFSSKRTGSKTLHSDGRQRTLIGRVLHVRKCLFQVNLFESNILFIGTI